MENKEMESRTAFISILGRPNVGKSTLLNNILGEKVAAVSKKPQTTRTRITGILTKGATQLVFLDTPGIHLPRTRLGDMMIREINNAVVDVDCALLLVEPGDKVGAAEESIIAKCEQNGLPVILLINKIDEHKKDIILTTIAAFSERFDFAAIIPISALTGEGTDEIFKELEPFISEGDWFFPSDMITDQPERAIAAEVIREILLRLLDKEIPHGTAVIIEDFTDVRGHLLEIRAEIYCEKASHKGIIIGKNGAMLKKIGSFAREDLESFFGVKVDLKLWVKVKENWRDDVMSLNMLGFNRNDD